MFLGQWQAAMGVAGHQGAEPEWSWEPEVRAAVAGFTDLGHPWAPCPHCRGGTDPREVEPATFHLQAAQHGAVVHHVQHCTTGLHTGQNLEDKSALLSRWSSFGTCVCYAGGWVLGLHEAISCTAHPINHRTVTLSTSSGCQRSQRAPGSLARLSLMLCAQEPLLPWPCCPFL